jgi:hypothetical protein
MIAMGFPEKPEPVLCCLCGKPIATADEATVISVIAAGTLQPTKPAHKSCCASAAGLP